MAERHASRQAGALDARWRAFAELGRVSNLPTCVSNVLVGCALGTAAGAAAWSWTRAAWLSAAICLLYVAGTALNDVADLALDRRQRPGRPLPSGRVRPGAARLLIVAFFAAGLLMLARHGRAAALLGAALVAAIVIYDLLNKRFPLVVALMGVCRGLVYLVAAAALSWPLDAARSGGLAAALALYTVGITVVARSETAGKLDARRWLALPMIALVLLPAMWIRPSSSVAPVLAGALLGAWLLLAVRAVFARPPRTVRAVLTWLSGMCLVDAYFLALLDRPQAALVALGCFAVSAWGHRHVLGT